MGKAQGSLCLPAPFEGHGVVMKERDSTSSEYLHSFRRVGSLSHHSPGEEVLGSFRGASLCRRDLRLEESAQSRGLGIEQPAVVRVQGLCLLLQN